MSKQITPHPLTLKQELLLQQIIAFMAEHGKGPSIRQVQALGNFQSTRTAVQYLQALEAAGYIERGQGRRALRVLVDPSDVKPQRKSARKKRKSAGAANARRPSHALLADATDLDGWATRRDAQSLLPQLVRRLVFATTDRTGHVTFGSGEAVQYGGWDGVTDFTARTTFVPVGRAGWELGTSADVADKANDDYTKRTADPRELVPAESTFVFVTLRRWPEKAEWVERRRAEKKWRDVRAYDADDLETWLELAPGIHVWLSSLLGKHPDGVTDLETHWYDWTHATVPPLSVEFLLAGREQAVTAVHDWLDRSSGRLLLQAETRQEAIAVFAAALLQVPQDQGVHHLVRAVVVSTEAAWQRLILSRDPLILIPAFPPASIAVAERNGHRVVLPFSRADAAPEQAVRIGAVDRRAVEKSLNAAGVPDQEAATLARLARRSMTAFRRLKGVTSEFARPTWVTEGGRALRAVMLAGGFDETKDGDKDVLSRLSGLPFPVLTDKLVTLSNGDDAPVRHIGAKWLVVSKEDAWPLLARFLSREELQIFHDVAIEMLGAPDPRYDLAPGEQWLANVLGHDRPHSEALIYGFSDTLALMGARGDVTTTTAGESAQSIASAVVRRVLEKANDDWRIWASLSGVLPRLAEAAPDRFLDAVDQGSTGAAPVLKQMFSDAPGRESLTFSSPHPGLLWALERLAWAPEYLGRAAIALARLTALDQPRGTLGNRPDGSLREIFLCWHPQTHATLAQRLVVIDRLRQAAPDAAWNLMATLLPDDHSFATQHGPADWRPWGEEQPRTTMAEYAQAVRAIIERVLKDVGSEAGRWKDVISRLEKLGKEDALSALTALESVDASTLTADATAEIRTALRESISFHRSHPDAQWELGPADVQRMEVLYERFAPASATERYAWLFATRPALLEGRDLDWEAYGEALHGHRVAAVRELLAEGGDAAVVNFARAVEQPDDVGIALSATGTADASATTLLGKLLVSDEAKVADFARGFARESVRRRGRAWAEEVLAADANTWRPAQRAELLACLPYDEQTWRIVDGFGAETEAAYWQRVFPFGLPESHFEYGVGKILEHGRPFAAVHVLAAHLHGKRTPVSPALIADALEAALPSKETTIDRRDQNFGFNIGTLATRLAENPGDVPLSRVAAIEWQLVSALSRHDFRPRLLHAELARAPEFFTQLVSIVYRGEHDEPKELDERERRQTRAAYELLESWRSLPGTTGQGAVDQAGLTTWVRTARELLAAADRRKIGDIQIGHVLGNSPTGEDGLWPHEAVREAIETDGSPEITRGVGNRVYNSRGVVTKSLDEGGAQERELTARYARYAAAMADRWPQTAAMLRDIVRFYDRDGVRSDDEVELRHHVE